MRRTAPSVRSLLLLLYMYSTLLYSIFARANAFDEILCAQFPPLEFTLCTEISGQRMRRSRLERYEKKRSETGTLTSVMRVAIITPRGVVFLRMRVPGRLPIRHPMHPTRRSRLCGGTRALTVHLCPSSPLHSRPVPASNAHRGVRASDFVECRSRALR